MTSVMGNKTKVFAVYLICLLLLITFGCNPVMKAERRVLNNVGELNRVYLTGDLAQGTDSEMIDLILVGDINREYFSDLVIKAEKYIKKKIRFVVFQPQEFLDKKAKILQENDLLLWEK